ncbi:MAG: hypothetical protein KBA19_06790 [Negativicutes bacterium]|nr:hypothetical protein [Negativicutes bacterium]
MHKVVKIFMNNIEVGSIPFELYEKIKKDSYSSKRNYMLQVIKIFTLILNLVFKTIFYIPVAWTIFLILILTFDSNSLVDFISFLKDSSPELIANFIKQTLFLSFMITIMSVFISHIISFKKVTTVFDQAIEEAILKLLEIPERGKLFIQVEK